MNRVEAPRRPSASLVISCLALFVALSGSALALSRGEVKSKHIAANAVKSKHVATGAVRSSAIANGALNPVHFAPGVLPRASDSAFAQENHTSQPERIALGHHTTVLALDDPAGTGPITVSGPSRLNAHATATIHNTGDFGVIECRLAVFEQPGGGQVPFGQAGLESVDRQVITTIPTAGAIDVGAGTYDVELQCVTSQEIDGHINYWKGNIVVVATPR